MTLTSAAVAFRPELLAGHTDGIEVRFHPSMEPHQQRLMATLGVRVIFDENAPHACPSGPHDGQRRPS